MSYFKRKFDDFFKPQSVSAAWHLLTRGEKLRMKIIVGFQAALAILDLAAIAMFGIVSVITLNGIQSKEYPERLKEGLDLIGLLDNRLQIQVAVISLLAGSLLIFKTVISAIIYRRILFFLTLKSSVVGSRILESLTLGDYNLHRSKSPNETLFITTRGANYLVTGVLGSLIQLVTDAFLMIVIFVGLGFFDPAMSVLSLAYFLMISHVFLRFFAHRVQKMQTQYVDDIVGSERKILEISALYKELYVRNALERHLEGVRAQRINAARLNAISTFIPFSGKYWIEIAFVVGAILLGAVQFSISTGVEAITSLSVFIVAASRIMPALLRIQNSLILFKSSLGSAESTIQTVAKTEMNSLNLSLPSNVLPTKESFQPTVSFEHVSFSYPESREKLFSDLSLEIFEGEFFALVGPSGAGKSTLLDIALGLHEVEGGVVRIGKLRPREAILNFPGKVSYVAQESVFSESSIRENLILGFDSEHFTERELLEVLEKVRLMPLIRDLPNGIDESVGHRGANLSVGQRQRLSIARALLTGPRLLFLDEATSSLDAETESEIGAFFENLKGQTTLVVIAHRLSTIRNADRIAYLNHGKICDIGNFEELQAKNKEFAEQIRHSILS